MNLTLKRRTVFDGIGLHGGQRVRMAVGPAPRGTGIVFRRTDVAAAEAMIHARHDAVVDTRLCTRIANAHGTSVGTIEHLMAALAGSGISDALIEVDGPEVPIMDGSARGFLAAFSSAGLIETGAARAAIRIDRPVVLVKGDKRAALLPADRFEAAFTIDFADPAIGTQAVDLALSGGAFSDELAENRTFGMLAEVEALRQAGLARGGSLENAIVIDRGRVLNTDGLRRPDEFVRHKVLDAVGDLALAGAPIMGRYEGVRAGHEMTNLLLHTLFRSPDAWSWCELQPGQGMDLRLARPSVPGTARPVAV